MKNFPAYLAGFLALVIAGLVYLAFVFPATIQQWAAEGRALTGAQVALINLSGISSNYGYLLFPPLLVLFIGCAVCAFGAGGRQQREAGE